MKTYHYFFNPYTGEVMAHTNYVYVRRLLRNEYFRYMGTEIRPFTVTFGRRRVNVLRPAESWC